MAELVFNFSVMGGGKTTQLLLNEYNEVQRGRKAIIIKPAIDTREGKFHGWGRIKSRVIVGTHQALYVEKVIPEDYALFDIIFVDEIQFFKYEDIYALSEIVDKYDIDVICYGLKTNCEGHLFEGSEALLALADRCNEIQKVCKCGRLSNMHIRYINGKIAEDQKGIAIEKGNVTYESLCRQCWKKALNK